MCQLEDEDVSVQRHVVDKLVDELALSPSQTKLTVGVLRRNYYSYTFACEIVTDDKQLSVFIKIPKSDLRVHRGGILPISPVDRQMLAEEAGSLRHLEKVWNGGDLGIKWVRLLFELPEFNGLVMVRVTATDAFESMRRDDLLRWIRPNEQSLGIMRRIGTALGRFHKHETSSYPNGIDLTPKLSHYAAHLTNQRNSRLFRRVQDWADNFRYTAFPSEATTTLKGIDIRNVLLSQSGKLTLLDPGKMKRSHPEADLARFLMTYRILQWGRPWFALGWQPDPNGGRAFLDGYGSAGATYSVEVLQGYFIKEILKHWHAARVALQTKHWPNIIQWGVQLSYIDSFYERQLDNELRSRV